MKTEQYSVTLKSFIVYNHIRTRHASNVLSYDNRFPII